eukprot:TRINITY_DN13496_c0_g1_i1.p1 TRINITY_DN13496_c0_g1~~TRINITY_DN13496_c0_g1_i1.p1  ORF type:complete len:268 (+),score=24.57 TRINITY_DN13496_c0_g1_i1:102-905(+)
MLEVEAVVKDADLAARDEETGNVRGTRAELLWALGGWYANVSRRDSTWREVLSAGIRRWIPSDEEHHGWVLHNLARASMELPKALPLPKRLVRGHPVHAKDSQSAAAGASHVITHIFFLVVLLFPSSFFGFAIYLGSCHGDSRCPQDLAGLLVWFGAAGLATLMVDCANDGGIISLISSLLKVALGLTPWIGMAWMHDMPHEEAQICGPFMFHISRWLWGCLAMVEIYLAWLLAWSCHVARNHELALRRVGSGRSRPRTPQMEPEAG